MAAITGRLRGAVSDAPVHDDAGDRRSVTRRLPLPNGRALIGGLLVAVAAVGLVATQRRSVAEGGERVLIATRAIAPGATIVEDDLGWVSMTLYDGTAKRVFTESSDLAGKVAAVPIAADELISTAMIAASSPSASTGRRVTLDLPAAGALDGALTPGDRVDVVSTGDAEGSSTVIARGVMVAQVPDTDAVEGIGGNDRLRITLIAPDEQSAVALLDAAATRHVALLGSAAAGSAATK